MFTYIILSIVAGLVSLYLLYIAWFFWDFYGFNIYLVRRGHRREMGLDPLELRAKLLTQEPLAAFIEFVNAQRDKKKGPSVAWRSPYPLYFGAFMTENYLTIPYWLIENKFESVLEKLLVAGLLVPRYCLICAVESKSVTAVEMILRFEMNGDGLVEDLSDLKEDEVSKEGPVFKLLLKKLQEISPAKASGFLAS